MVYEFLTITHIVNNNSYELNNFEFIIGSVPLIRCTWTNRRRAVPFDPDRAIDCPDALSLPFVTEFWWRWLLPYFPLLQNSTTHLCPGRGASCTESTSLGRGGGDLVLWHLPLLSRNRALRSSCSVALQPCCVLKFWTLFEVDLLYVPFALLAASIDCSHCCYHSLHVCRRSRSIPPQPTDHLPALFSLLLLFLPHFFPSAHFRQTYYFHFLPNHPPYHQISSVYC